MRKKTVAALDPWLDRAGSSLVGSFARGLARDHLAVRAAIAPAWSNAQAEGQINRLKLVKRQMYGRGKLHLLQAAPRRPRRVSVIRSAPKPVLDADQGSGSNAG